MDDISSNLKDLISKILQPVDKRISIEEIFNHPWIKNEAPKTPLKLSFARMQNYSKYSKLKKIVANVISSQLS